VRGVCCVGSPSSRVESKCALLSLTVLWPLQSGQWILCKNRLVPQPPVRRANVADIPELLRLRGVMFGGMGIDTANAEWTVSTVRILERHLPSSTIVAAVVDRTLEPGICAAGLLQIQEGLGSPRFPKGLRGHVSSVAVDPEWRRRGLGEDILRFLLNEARTLGLERVELHATPDGERIYRKLGFHDRPVGVELQLDL